MIGAATVSNASITSVNDILKKRRQKSITLFCCTAAITPQGMATITAIATAMSASWAATSSIAPWRRAAIGRTRPFAPLRQPWSQPLPGESWLYAAVRAGCPVLVDRDPAEIIAHALGRVIRRHGEGEGLVEGCPPCAIAFVSPRRVSRSPLSGGHQPGTAQPEAWSRDQRLPGTIRNPQPRGRPAGCGCPYRG